MKPPTDCEQIRHNLEQIKKNLETGAQNMRKNARVAQRVKERVEMELWGDDEITEKRILPSGR